MRIKFLLLFSWCKPVSVSSAGLTAHQLVLCRCTWIRTISFAMGYICRFGIKHWRLWGHYMGRVKCTLWEERSLAAFEDIQINVSHAQSLLPWRLRQQRHQAACASLVSSAVSSETCIFVARPCGLKEFESLTLIFFSTWPLKIGEYTILLWLSKTQRHLDVSCLSCLNDSVPAFGDNQY